MRSLNGAESVLTAGALEPERVDPVDAARAQEYALLAVLMARSAPRELLQALAALEGNDTPLGRAHRVLAEVAAETNPPVLERDFFELFIGVGRGELMPYASFYKTGFLHQKPLSDIRRDLIAAGIERAGNISEPEDHIAVLFEAMSALLSNDTAFADPGITPEVFFRRHLNGWAARLFTDLERLRPKSFYGKVGALGRLFMDIEEEALALPA